MRTRYCDRHEKEYPAYQGCYECLFEDYHATQVMVTNLKGELAQWKENWQKEKSAHMLTIADSKTAESNLRAKLEEAQETAGRYYEDGRKMKAELDDALERVEKWKTWHDSASEDAKKWRRDAQVFYGALVKIAEYRGTKDEVWANNMRTIAKEALADRP